MSGSISKLSLFVYPIIGLVVLIILVQVLGLLLRLITGVLDLALSVALLLAIGYVVVLLVNADLRILHKKAGGVSRPPRVLSIRPISE